MARSLSFVTLLAALTASGATLKPRAQFDASACVTTTLSCNTTIDGALAAGDCVDTDGSHYDVYRFAGSVGQLITVTIFPLDGSLPMPYISLDTPPGDASGTPFVGGAGTPSFRFALTSNGNWTIFAGSIQPFDAGRYRLSLQCQATSLPANQMFCVVQPFACGQIASWSLAPSSCKFSDGSVFASYSVAAGSGAPFDFRLHSDDFDPGLALYRGGGSALTSGFGRRFTTDARITYFTSSAGSYEIAAFGANGQTSGEFTLYGDCPAPLACIPPTIVVQPQSASILAGGSTTLNVSASGSAPFTYSWHDSLNGPLTIGTSQSLPVVNLTRTTTYSVDVTNACGSATSNVATLTVKPARHRSSRH